MEVRRAVEADAPVIARLNAVVQGLHHAAHPELFRRPNPAATEAMLWEPLGGDDAWCFLAEEGTEAVGYVVALRRARADTPVTVPGDFLELNQIAVLPEWEHRGVGRTLVERVLALGGELGVTRVELNVWEFNARAREFFGRAGFRPLQHRMGLDL